MKEKKKVLIFPAGTEIGMEINNALKYSTFFQIIGGTSLKDHSEYVYKNCIDGIPFVTAPNFIEKLNEVIRENAIEFIYPAHDSVVLFLTENQDKILAKVVSSELNTVKICRSKRKTYEYLKELDFIPKFYESIEEVESFPVFIKPDIGQGSVGAKKIESKQELEQALIDNKDIIICELLPGKEYTIDCFTDKFKKLRVAKIRDRARIKTGISVNSKILKMEEKVLRIAEQINDKFNFNGAWFFQLKKDNNEELKLLEISPRIPGTNGVSRNLGINFPLLTLFNNSGYDINILENDYEIEVDRAFINRYKTNLKYDTVYVDLDDTLILDDNRVNSFLMMFIYQAINNNKKIILVTKHKYNVLETLKKFKISESIFDKIIHINQEDKKSKYLNEKLAIFIDDSFGERKDVKDNSDIKTFDLDMVESLIDWKI